ncbi:unnamed protein product [Cuscuta epithymum]|uniref:FAF domain-containing protein n=1 Tax=Cuscuta epithymum TaxID=186058 RepID=A0AAV0FA19_9ASTE|nr:unnamed protein product [Cuscuta epithymum]
MMNIRSCGHFVCDEDEKVPPPPHSCHRETGSDDDDVTMYDELDSPEQSSTISSSDDGASEMSSSMNDNCSGGGWSFLVEELQADAAGEVAHVQPRRMKRSLSTLSSKSLEMCTEGLGCETGFGITQSMDDLLGNPAPAPEGSFAPPPTMPAGRPPVMIASRKFNRTKSFPPPLSSAKDQQREDGVKMLLRRREGGRLVVTAVCLTRPDSFFRENRSGGRLRLSFKMGAADLEDVCEESIED